jgi:Transposase domain (DUF772)
VVAFTGTRRPGQPPLPTRLVAGLFILKHMHNLSDEALCDRWVENPYFQYFCGEVVFRHELPFDRSSLTRWRPKRVWSPGVRFRHTAFAQRRWRSGFRKSMSTRSSGLLTMACVLGRDIASRTRCREETSHVLQHIDLADPQS